MAKIRPARGRARPAPARSGLGCLVLLVSGLILSLMFMYFFFKTAGG